MIELAVPAGHSSGHTTSTGWLIFGIALVVIGGLQAGKPDLGWRMSRWQFRNPEANAPSEAALTFTRVVGALAAVAGVVVVILAATR